ncbi:RNA polymerase II subunit A C-terminal domain phosphatase [Pitangus sulphuratus]|nr:RNA polymerase II subunit A C-terminal domain phosphatase [Pitangus sulphuratus]
MSFSPLLMETIGHDLRRWTQKDGNQTVYINEDGTFPVKIPISFFVQWKANFRMTGNFDDPAGLSSTAAGSFKSPATGEAKSDFAQTLCTAAAHPGFRLEQGLWITGKLLSRPVCKPPHGSPGREGTFSKSAGHTKPGGGDDRLNGCGAIQKDLDTLKKWAKRNFMKFKKRCGPKGAGGKPDLFRIRSRNGKQNVPLSTATVSMVHSVPELKVSSEQAEQLGREDQQRLHRNRKLVLMVDLDQTLIHTTEQHCQQMSNKGIFHFQLGRGEPMLHTRLRPHCKEFLEKIAKLYELHVFTFGSRLYAHTIAGFLDPEKKLFSHRILSRDECIDPFSKTGNLRDLFPCGDSMVCIIDDREDVWKFAPNLITVKKYVYFQGIGDINAPPGSREMQMKKKVNHSTKPEVLDPAVTSAKDAEEIKNVICVEEQSNGLKKAAKDTCTENGSTSVSNETSDGDMNSRVKVDAQDSLNDSSDHKMDSEVTNDLTNTSESQIFSEQVDRTVTEKQQTQEKTANVLDFELSSDSESDGGLDTRKSSTSVSDSENEEKRSWKKSKQPLQDENLQKEGCTDVSEKKDGLVNHSGDTQSLPGENTQDKTDLEAQEESEQESLCDLGNGCADKKEAETESQNSEQSGITMGESLDQSMEEEEEEDDTDDDDHLIYLEEILVRVHTDYYTKYDKYLKKEIEEIPDIRKIVPELKSKVLSDVTIIFSGLYPTNFPIEKTREHYHATALGAKIVKNLVLSADDPDKATHLIAARTGTEKVRQAQDCKDLHVVNPDWLWSCLERWDKVEEQLFPLKDDYIKTHRENSPATFPDTPSTFQTALFHPTPIHPKSQPGPEVRLYDPNTGKLIRKGTHTSGQSMYIQSPAPPITLPVHGEHSSFRYLKHS